MEEIASAGPYHAYVFRVGEDVPCGIIYPHILYVWVNNQWNLRPFWVKIENEWHYFRNLEINFISEPEFETEIAFETFPVLEVTHRKFRMWLKYHKKFIKNSLLLLSFGAFLISINMLIHEVPETKEGWFVAMFLLSMSIFGILVSDLTEEWNWWRNTFDMPLE